MKFLIKRLAPYKLRMAVGLIIKISGTVAELLLPVILSYILDNVIKTESGEAMMPAVEEFVKKIDLDEGIYVKPIEGMF